MNEVTRERVQSFLADDHIARIVGAYKRLADMPGLARVTAIDEVRKKGTSLSIPLYVRQGNGNGTASRGNAVQEETSLREVIDKWQESSAALRLSMEQLFATLRTEGKFSVAGFLKR